MAEPPESVEMFGTVIVAIQPEFVGITAMEVASMIHEMVTFLSKVLLPLHWVAARELGQVGLWLSWVASSPPPSLTITMRPRNLVKGNLLC